MGCDLTKEKIQTDILVLLLEKAEIQEERERLIYQLQLLTRKNQHPLSISTSNQSKKQWNQVQDAVYRIHNNFELLTNIKIII